MHIFGSKPMADPLDLVTLMNLPVWFPFLPMADPLDQNLIFYIEGLL